MKKSIAISSIYLLLLFSCYRADAKVYRHAQTETVVKSVQIQTCLSYINGGCTVKDDENDPDPPRKDPWQWKTVLKAIFYFLMSSMR